MSDTEKIELPLHYTSIDDLPMVRWDNIWKGKGYENLLHRIESITGPQQLELRKVWKKLNDEFISVFGFGNHTHLIINKKIKLAKLKLKKIITGDRSISNFISRVENELLTLTSISDKSADVYELKMIIEQHNPGMYIPMSTITVREFHSYLKNIEKRSRK